MLEMLKKVLVGLAAPLCFLVIAITTTGAQTPAQWRPGDSLAIGSTVVHVEVSPSKEVRVVFASATQTLISADMQASALQRWTESVLVGLALGWRTPFEFENSLALQQGVDQSKTAGFVITVADSIGGTQSVFANPLQTEAFVALVEHAATRAVSERNIADESRCEHVRDSVFAQVLPRDWPRAKIKDQAAAYGGYPRLPRNAPPAKPIVVDVVMLPNGSLDSTFFAFSGLDDASYKQKALEFVMKAEWQPAQIEGCPVVSKAGFMATSIGIRR